MFKKPFNVKKNTNQRNSDTRKLFNRLKEEVTLDTVIDKKGQVAQVKISNFDGQLLQFYTVDKTPMFFEFTDAGNIYPTVYYLWANPAAFPVIVCHEPVFSFLENGADLMLPGTIRSGGKFEFPQYRKGGPVAIAFYNSETDTVTGPSAVGCSTCSSEDAAKGGFKGKGVQVLHVFRDHLWEFGPKGVPPTYRLEEWRALFKPESEPAPSVGWQENDEVSDEETPSELIHEVVDEQEEVETETMEQVLLRCFLAGLKYRFTRNMLPMDVGQFYTQIVLSCVPDGKKLDMKKTKYKKFGTFVQEANKMSDSHIIKITTPKDKKGADVVTEVNFSNKMFRDFEVTDETIVDELPASEEKFDRPSIAEFLSVTEPTVPLFPGHSKGDLLTVKQIKDFVTKYVNDNHLTTAKSIRLDPLLAAITHIKTECATWQDVVKEVHGRMTATWYIRWMDGREIVRKVHQPRIEFKIENRAGNKKVTLINGLPMFGIDLKTICHQIQTGVATSVTSQWDVPGVEGPQVLVQGNQIHYISDLLIKSYCIDKKYLKGMELAIKKKK